MRHCTAVVQWDRPILASLTHEAQSNSMSFATSVLHVASATSPLLLWFPLLNPLQAGCEHLLTALSPNELTTKVKPPAPIGGATGCTGGTAGMVSSFLLT